jgi:hypothetical protein
MLAERIALIKQLVGFVLDNRIPVQLISIDVDAHRAFGDPKSGLTVRGRPRNELVV